MTAQGQVVMAMHELIDRHGEIPDVDDAYIVGMWNEDHREDAVDEEEGGHPLWDIPWRLDQFDAFKSAREARDPSDIEGYKSDRDAFEYQWPSTGIFRIGCNTYSVQAPVYLRIRWGHGHPKTDDGLGLEVEMLPHELVHEEWCKHCGKKVGGASRDCATRRLRALAEAVRSLGGRDRVVKQHLLAVARWHGAR